MSMRISGSGIAYNGRAAIKRRRELWMAADAISCLHDAPLAVAKGDITPEQVREFFWKNDLAEATFIGGVLSFEEKRTDVAEGDRRDSERQRARSPF